MGDICVCVCVKGITMECWLFHLINFLYSQPQVIELNQPFYLSTLYLFPSCPLVILKPALNKQMKKNRKWKSINGDEIAMEGRVTDGQVPGSQVKCLGSRWGGKQSKIPHSCHFCFLSFKSYGFCEANSSHMQLCSDFYFFINVNFSSTGRLHLTYGHMMDLKLLLVLI